jgi:DNA-binding transcriptional ArsR family regulator
VVHPEQTPGDVSVVFDGDAVAVRMYVSPLFTVIASVFEVLLGWRRGVPEDWAKLVRSRIRGVDLSALRAFDGPDRTVPNFLLPLPPSASPTLAEELAVLRATPNERIRADLLSDFGEDVPAGYRPFVDSTSEALDDLCASLTTYWKAGFEPMWPQIRAVLEREVGLAGRELVTKGTTAVLRSLHARVTVHPGRLHYPSPQRGRAAVDLGRRVLALVPMVCGPRALLTSEDRDDAIVIAYAARGVGAVWRPVGSEQDMALANLLGDTRARVVEAIRQPATTQAVAGLVGISPANASHHLNALALQGLARRDRVGKAVFYALSERGAALFELFGA